MRNLLKTPTALGVYTFALAAIAPVFPAIYQEVQGFVLSLAPPNVQVVGKSVLTVVGITAASCLTLAAKYHAGDYYTPHGVPGRDKEDSPPPPMD